MPKCTRSGWFGLCVSLRQCSQAGKLEQLLSIMQKNSYRCTLAWRWVCTCQELKTEREFVQKQTGSTSSHAQTSSHRRGGEVLTPSNRKTGLFEIPPSLTSTALLICLCISFFVWDTIWMDWRICTPNVLPLWCFACCAAGPQPGTIHQGSSFSLAELVPELNHCGQCTTQKKRQRS